MEKLSKKFNSGGWTFTYDLLPGSGLVLGNVRHDDYYFAKDMRVVAVWVYPMDTDKHKPKSFYLGTEEFPEVPTADKTHLRWNNFNAPPPFDVYTQGGLKGPAGLQAKYKTKTKVFGDDKDKDDDHLFVEQSYIFGKYGKDPAHEPGGVLEAARILPLVKFSYGGKKIKSIRIDYRFEISLDLFLYRDSGTLMLDPLLDTGVLKKVLKNIPRDEIKKRLIQQLKDKRPTLAAIFRDTEQFPDLPRTDDVFDAYEKPVLWEIVAYGLKNGIPGDKVTTNKEAPRVHEGPVSVRNFVAHGDQSTWDNIHMWSNCRLGNSYLKKQLSTPGAFHSFHFHWRWAYYFSDPTLLDRLRAIAPGVLTGPFGYPVSNSFGEKQFKGLPLCDGIGGPLLDPKIPTQTIQFAITKTKPPEETKPPNKWDADQRPTKQKFEKLFFNPEAASTPEPRDISGGGDLITWLSVAVENSPAKGQAKKTFGGTVLPHGIFFAHNAELSIFQVPTAMTSGVEPMQKPDRSKDPTPTWLRSPNDK